MMESKHKNRTGALIKKLLIDNVVTILFVVICIAGIILANQPLSHVIGEISTRLFRNLILILALLVPVWAGMGMNFSIVLGAMAAQIGIIVSINFSLSGVAALILAFIVSVPLSLFFGNLIGRLFNRTKGQEMITGMIVGFFAKGLYDLVFMFLCGPVIPVKNETLLLTNGIGLTTPINLDSATKGAINKMWTVSLEKFLYVILIITIVVLLISALLKSRKKKAAVNWKKQYGLISAVIGLIAYQVLLMSSETVKFALNFTDVPVATGILIAIVGVYITFLSKTKLGSDINAVGQNRNIAISMGIPADKIRITAIMIST